MPAAGGAMQNASFGQSPASSSEGTRTLREGTTVEMACL
jgi:hypothetical protein